MTPRVFRPIDLRIAVTLPSRRNGWNFGRTSDGGVGLASARQNRSINRAESQLLELTVYDAAGSPDPMYSSRTLAPITVDLAFDETGDGFILAESQFISSSESTITRLRRDGSIRWQSTVAGTGEITALHVYQDASGPRVAAFGGANDRSRIDILDADSGEHLTTHETTGNGPWLSAVPLQTPGRFLAARRDADGPDTIQELDLFVPDPFVVETDAAFEDFSVRVAPGFAYQTSNTSLYLYQSEGSASRIQLSAGASEPIGLVELDNDRFGIAVRRGGPSEADGYIVIGQDGVDISITLAVDGTSAEVESIAPGGGGRAGLLLRFNDSSIAGGDASAIVEIGSDGQVARS